MPVIWRMAKKSIRNKLNNLLKNLIISIRFFCVNGIMNQKLHDYYLSKDEPIQSCLLALRSIILSCNTNISESLKWGLPCFSTSGKNFAFLNVDRRTNETYILFSKGNELDWPELEKGNRKKMKIFRVNPAGDIPFETINLLLKKTLNLYR